MRQRLRAALRWLRRHAPFPTLVIIAIVFRLPRLVNAADLNADYGIIGLQAIHILHGEFSLHLWGADYQSSLEPTLLAGAFAIFGAKAVFLLLEPLASLLVQMAVVHGILVRRVSRFAAFMATLTLAISPWSATWLSLYGPRQLAVAIVFIGIGLFDRAAERKRRRPFFFVLGAFAIMFAVSVDVLMLQLLPPVFVFAFLCAFDNEAAIPQAVVRLLLLGLGLAAGYVALRLLQGGNVPGGAQCLSIDHVPRNAHLLWDQCLPAALAVNVYVPGKNLYPTLWTPPTWFAKVQLAGAAAVLLAYVSTQGALIARIPWEARRLAMLALLAVASCFASFLIGCRASDVWAMRYLAPITWFLPFALAAGFWRFPKITTLILAPYLISATVGGWLAYGLAVDGIRIVETPRGAATDERWLATALKIRGVHYAAAQYFLSYRLSFLWNEDPIVVPIEANEDRYPPQRAAFNSAKKAAYIFHPSEPRAVPETYEAQLRAAQLPYERETIAGFTVLVFTRP